MSNASTIRSDSGSASGEGSIPEESKVDRSGDVQQKASRASNAPRQETLKQKLAADPLLFGRVCLPGMMYFSSPPFHREIITELLNPMNRKISIIAPRGHAKSSLVAGVYALWYLFNIPGRKVLVLVSKTSGHAERLLGTIQNALEYSSQLHALYGYHGMHRSRKWTNSEIILDNGDVITTKGTGQMIVGLKYGDQRPTLVILDDPEDLNNTLTAEAMEKNQKWLFTQLVPTLDAHRGRLVIIGTPQHELCIVETLKKATGWKNMFYSAIQPDGTALWPEQWPLKRLEEEKESLSSIGKVSYFYREYMCQIVGDEDQLFKPHYIKRYKGQLELAKGGSYEHVLVLESIEGQRLPKPERLAVHVFMGVDPASSTKQTADYSVVLPVAVDNKGRRFILPIVRNRLTPLALAEKIIDKYLETRPIKTRIETVGYQEMLREYIREVSSQRGIYIPGLEIKENPRQSKSFRLESLEPFFAAGQVFLMEGDTIIEQELLSYPRGKHDDILDAMYYAFKGNFKPYHNPDPLNLKKSVRERVDDLQEALEEFQSRKENELEHGVFEGFLT